MKPIVFDTVVENGTIRIPLKHRRKARSRMKVILLPEEKRAKGDLSEEERKKNWEIIMKGGDGKSIKDPVKWQREIRKDRKLPFRD
ncbi:MAG: hypothetical protein SH857_13825 [Chitinophagales bacterium]|nr:hypothetical protein [Chitinophagales bacterium]